MHALELKQSEKRALQSLLDEERDQKDSALSTRDLRELKAAVAKLKSEVAAKERVMELMYLAMLNLGCRTWPSCAQFQKQNLPTFINWCVGTATWLLL